MAGVMHVKDRLKEPIMLRNAPIRAYIPASDLSRARKFYEEIVGLTSRPRWPS
jgi:predicted enzyme related to lactoylglutathione lyase